MKLTDLTLPKLWLKLQVFRAMGRQIDKTKIGSIAESFEEVQEWQSTVNLRELVESLFAQIDAARQKKASWEAITERIQKVLGKDTDLKPATIRQYYYDALKAQDNPPKSIKPSARSRSTAASVSSQAAKTSQSKSAQATEKQDNKAKTSSRAIGQTPTLTESNHNSIPPTAPLASERRRKWTESEFNTNTVRPT